MTVVSMESHSVRFGHGVPIRCRSGLDQRARPRESRRPAARCEQNSVKLGNRHRLGTLDFVRDGLNLKRETSPVRRGWHRPTRLL
jgi:hypothetical protein